MGASRTRAGDAGVAPSMTRAWLQDLESLEAITRSEDARKIFLKMAALSRTGGTPGFLAELEHDPELDETTKGHVAELAQDRSFLVAVEEYLRRTERVH